jgi:hypothetical protein
MYFSFRKKSTPVGRDQAVIFIEIEDKETAFLPAGKSKIVGWLCWINVPATHPVLSRHGGIMPAPFK